MTARGAVARRPAARGPVHYGWVVVGVGVVVSMAVLGIARFAFGMVIAAVLLRNDPAEVGLTPAGHPIRDATVPEPVSVPEQRRTTTKLGLIYTLYGFSYAIYVTFIVTSLVDERGIAESSAGQIWFIVGFLSLFCSLFGAFSDRVGRKLGLATVFALHAVAYLIVGLQLPGVLLYLSVFLFGICAWSVPGIMGATAGDYMPPKQAIKALGVLTDWSASARPRAQRSPASSPTGPATSEPAIYWRRQPRSSAWPGHWPCTSPAVHTMAGGSTELLRIGLRMTAGDPGNHVGAGSRPCTVSSAIRILPSATPTARASPSDKGSKKSRRTLRT